MQQRPDRVVGDRRRGSARPRTSSRAGGRRRSRGSRARPATAGPRRRRCSGRRARRLRRRWRARPDRRRSTGGCRGPGARPRDRRGARRRSPGRPRPASRSRGGSAGAPQRTGAPRGRPRSARSGPRHRRARPGHRRRAPRRSASRRPGSCERFQRLVERLVLGPRRPGRLPCAPRASWLEPRSGPTARAARPRSRDASSARAWPGT